MRLGPDSARYWLAGDGVPVARPFYLRWLLPWVCRNVERRWWAVWGCSWVLLWAGTFWFATRHLPVLGAVTAATITVGFAGTWGPQVVRPVGVDLPAMALAVVAAAAAQEGLWWAAVPAVFVAATVKESAPVWAALWAWHPILLVGLAAPLVRSVLARPALDEVTAKPVLREIHDHPVRTALRARRWRDGWVMAAPWGVGLAALLNPSPQLVVAVVVAHLQLLVATDTVRLLHTAVGPLVAVAAVQVIPPQWWPVAVVAHVFWFRTPEVI